MIANESHLPLKIRTVGLQQIADAAGCSFSAITGKSQKGIHVACRAIYVEILLKQGGMSLSAIGKIINRDHATVLFYRDSWSKNNEYYRIKDKLEL